MWEAFEHAAFAGLDNLIAILDINRLGQRGETMHGWDLSSYTRRVEACGWAAIEIDGHDVDAIDRAYEEALSTTGRPTAIVARTIKGKGVKAVENQDDWHGKALDDPERRSRSSAASGTSSSTSHKPEGDAAAHVRDRRARAADLRVGERGRDAQGVRRRAARARQGRAATSSRSTARSRTRPTPRSSRRRIPDRYFEMYIAEQQLVAAAVGLQVRNWTPFASTFAAFLSRAYDFIRMAAISQRGHPARAARTPAFRSARTGRRRWRSRTSPRSARCTARTVLYPSDANQTAKLVAAMADLDGISFIRTTRGATPVIYDAGEDFPVGGAKVVREGDDVTLVGAGITLHEALKAADALAERGQRRRA